MICPTYLNDKNPGLPIQLHPIRSDNTKFVSNINVQLSSSMGDSIPGIPQLINTGKLLPDNYCHSAINCNTLFLETLKKSHK